MAEILADCSLLILAGGKSKRMGKDKAGLLLQGETFLDILIKKGKEIGFPKIILSGHTVSCEGIAVIEDIYRERGPLGGMHAGFLAAQTPYCFVICVDVPQIAPSLMLDLIRAHRLSQTHHKGLGATVFRHKGQTEPLIGVYNTSLASLIEPLICMNGAPVLKFLDAVGYQAYESVADETGFLNINTPEVYQQVVKWYEKR